MFKTSREYINPKNIFPACLSNIDSVPRLTNNTNKRIPVINGLSLEKENRGKVKSKTKAIAANMPCVAKF